jgi:hypothetical protein
LVTQRATTCPPQFRRYWERLERAERQQALIPVSSLLRLDWPGILRQPDVSLAYAEGWALALRTLSAPIFLDQLRDALARRSILGAVPVEDGAFWTDLDAKLLSGPRQFCQ